MNAEAFNPSAIAPQVRFAATLLCNDTAPFTMSKQSNQADEMCPRYCRARPLPRSRYVPGLVPHAQKPRGEGAVLNWNGDGALLLGELNYLWGVDLFNHGYYWEAHEVWEGLWKQAQVGTSIRLFLQGLIQAAGAMLKVLTNQRSACESLAARARTKFTKAVQLGGSRQGGVDVAPFADALLRFCSAVNSVAEEPRLRLKTEG